MTEAGDPRPLSRFPPAQQRRVEDTVLAAGRRALPFVLTGLLLFNLLDAILGGRAAWLMVGLVAMALALSIWRRHRAAS